MALIKLNLGSGKKLLKDFVNLDEINGWHFQDRLDYPDESISAVTISHFLTYLTDKELALLLKEVWRVLKVGAIMRITEDDTENPDSDTYQKGWKNVKILTGPMMIRKLLEPLGFEVWDLDEKTSYYGDLSLIQNYHGGRPRCFFLEASKLEFNYDKDTN